MATFRMTVTHALKENVDVSAFQTPSGEMLDTDAVTV